MKPRLKPLAEQTVVITGATSGIGLVTARIAAEAGAAVFLIARGEAGLAAVCGEIEVLGGQAGYAVADVGDEAQVRAACDAAIARFGGFDTWINLAGVAIYAPLLDTPWLEHERLFRTNYWGTVNGSMAAVHHLQHKGGALITVGSVVSDIGTPVLGAYAASKHAVKGFTDSLRIELLAAGSPLSVTLIKPAGVGTPLADHAANHLGHAAKVPPPAYDPHAVARAILRCAEHPRRELVVGGVGALQLVGHALFPGAVDRVSTWIIPLLGDRSRPVQPGNNLFAPGRGGQERSPGEQVLPGAHAVTAAHPGWITAGAMALVAALLLPLLGPARRRIGGATRTGRR